MSFTNHKDKSNFHIKELPDIEFANPIDFWRAVIMDSNIWLMRKDIATKEGCKNLDESTKKQLLEHAHKRWLKWFKKVFDKPINENLLHLLQTNKKNEQEKLLNGLCLERNDLLLLYFIACSHCDFTFSNYTRVHFKGIDSNRLPEFAHIEKDDKLTIIGNSKAGDKEIKHAIKNQHRIVIRFLDKANTWHCFFQTMKGISGQETGQNSHLHYISSSWNISRENVLKELLKEKYKLPRLSHIAFKR